MPVAKATGIFFNKHCQTETPKMKLRNAYAGTVRWVIIPNSQT
jgi:hypothetical protein